MINERVDQGKGRRSSQALLTHQENVFPQIEAYNVNFRQKTRQSHRIFQSFNERAREYERMNKCIYCKKLNHSIDTCRMKVRHDQERNQSSNYSEGYNRNRNQSRSRNYKPPSAHLASESKQDEERIAQPCDEEEAQQREPNVEDSNEDEILSPWDCLLVETALTVGLRGRSNVGMYTPYVCHNLDLFTTKLTPIKDEVFLGDGRSLKIEGVGTVQFNTRNSLGKVQPIILRRCFYIPTLKRNLISLSEMAKDKIHIDFNTDTSKVILSKEGSKIFACKEQGGNLYLFKGIEQKGTKKRVQCEFTQVTEFSNALTVEATLEM
jgi:hypothetical protein